MVSEIFGNTVPGNELVSDGTKPLPESMLIYHLGDPVTITILQEIRMPKCHLNIPVASFANMD